MVGQRISSNLARRTLLIHAARNAYVWDAETPASSPCLLAPLNGLRACSRPPRSVRVPQSNGRVSYATTFHSSDAQSFARALYSI